MTNPCLTLRTAVIFGAFSLTFALETENVRRPVRSRSDSGNKIYFEILFILALPYKLKTA